MLDILRAARAVLDTVLFRIGDTPISISTIITALLVILAAFWVSSVIRGLIDRGLSRRGAKPGAIGTINGLIHYSVLFTGFGVALGTTGIDLTALFAAGAIFAVGIGFAMQSIAQNFVAGVILLAERSIKPGDVLEVEGKIVKLLEMGIRASIARTRDGEDLIVPNSTLIQTTVKNYTLRNSAYRIRVPVGVVYRSDMGLVKRTLTDVAHAVSARVAMADREPQIILTAFGDNAVQWEVAVWIDDPWAWRVAASELSQAIWDAFQKLGIVIAFPQLDVHFDAPIEDSIGILAASRAA